MTYKTVAGDMWDFIALKTLGSESFTEQLINANRQFLNFFIFPAGIELQIPEIKEEKAAYLPPWRR